MMKKLCNIIFLFLAFYTQAQDIHFSQYRQSPLLLNPAMTGKFNGDYRLGMNYRNQWSGFTVPYVTYSGFVDNVIKKNIFGNDHFAGGIAFYSDKAGVAEFLTNSFYISFSYSKILGATGAHEVSVAVGGGYVRKSVNYDNLKFPNQYQSIVFSPELSNKETLSSNAFGYPDINTGAMWQYLVKTGLKVHLAAGLFHLIGPKESFLPVKDNVLNMRYNILLGAEYDVSEKFSLLPSLLYTGQSKATEFVAGATVSYMVRKTPISTTKTLFGISYRMADAIILITGIEHDNFRFAISYDINISSLRNATRGNGAYELSLIYIINTKQKVDIIKTIPCKRL